MLASADGLGVEGDDDVVEAQAGFIGGGAGDDVLDDRAFFVIEGEGTKRRRAADGENGRSPDVALGEAIPGQGEGVDGDVHVDAGELANAAVDADESALEVEERSAGIAADEGATGDEGAGCDVDDAAKAEDWWPVAAESAGVAEGDAPMADFDGSGVGDFDEGPVAGGGDLDQGGVGPAVDAEGFAASEAAVGEEEDHVEAGVGGDVAGGEDVAVLDDDAGALAGGCEDGDGGGEDLIESLLDLGLDGAEVGEGGWGGGGPEGRARGGNGTGGGQERRARRRGGGAEE